MAARPAEPSPTRGLAPGQEGQGPGCFEPGAVAPAGMHVAMSRIQQLPARVVNQIAAGEVIERPASLVKELVENALDAGANRVDVSLERGGADLVRVSDDGGGIDPEDLVLAVSPHATSKLRGAEDLFRVATLGFRGEALASIAEVSRLTLRSRLPEATTGWQLEVDGGQRSEPAPCGCPTGTAIEVRDLFFNTPVRRKFLRATQTELAHASEAFTRVALAYPQVHFTLRHHDRPVFDLPPADPWLERIAQIYGRDLARSLIWVESQDAETRLWGYVAEPTQSRSHARMQYLFLNGRHIRDRALQHALSEAYRGLLLGGRYPIAFLALDLPPDQVDVNVHPTKLEVRFQDSGRLYSQLLGTLRNKFLTTDLHAQFRVDSRGLAGAPAGPTQDSRFERGTQGVAEQQLVDWAREQLAARRGPLGGEPAGSEPATSQRELELTGAQHAPLSLHELPPELLALAQPSAAAALGASPSDEAREPLTQGYEPVLQAPHGASSIAAAARSAMPSAAHGVRSSAALQIHNRYLITESDEGVVVIDQHALHERILYEEIRQRVLAGALETQRLLVPEPVDLAPAERAAVLEHAELLGQLGVEIMPFGGSTVLVSSYPAMLRRVAPAELVRGLAEQLVGGGKKPDRRDLLDELLHLMSCKAAIKAGDPLSGDEIAALLARRHLVQDAHHCPHGRPTALVFTREQLDRQFQRI